MLLTNAWVYRNEKGLRVDEIYRFFREFYKIKSKRTVREQIEFLRVQGILNIEGKTARLNPSSNFPWVIQDLLDETPGGAFPITYFEEEVIRYTQKSGGRPVSEVKLYSNYKSLERRVDPYLTKDNLLRYILKVYGFGELIVDREFLRVAALRIMRDEILHVFLNKSQSKLVNALDNANFKDILFKTESRFNDFKNTISQKQEIGRFILEELQKDPVICNRAYWLLFPPDEIGRIVDLLKRSNQSLVTIMNTSRLYPGFFNNIALRIGPNNGHAIYSQLVEILIFGKWDKPEGKMIAINRLRQTNLLSDSEIESFTSLDSRGFEHSILEISIKLAVRHKILSSMSKGTVSPMLMFIYTEVYRHMRLDGENPGDFGMIGLAKFTTHFSTPDVEYVPNAFANWETEHDEEPLDSRNLRSRESKPI